MASTTQRSNGKTYHNNLFLVTIWYFAENFEPQNQHISVLNDLRKTVSYFNLLCAIFAPNIQTIVNYKRKYYSKRMCAHTSDTCWSARVFEFSFDSILTAQFKSAYLPLVFIYHVNSHGQCFVMLCFILFVCIVCELEIISLTRLPNFDYICVCSFAYEFEAIRSKIQIENSNIVDNLEWNRHQIQIQILSR